jgi:hypothetical protein
MSTPKASVPPPLSEPALARRAPAELVAHTEEPPPSIRVGAQASRPPVASEREDDSEDDAGESGVHLVLGAKAPKVPNDATG